ncbi:hypothetical protein [Sphingomonas beigongshangi]|nr:hypothetical protein [Sphingomonas beigongshangi]
MRKLHRRERIALKWAFALFVFFWVAVIVFRIVLMSSQPAGGEYFS